LGVGGAVARSWLQFGTADVEATQTLHSRVGSCYHVICVLRVVVDLGVPSIA
jgi:hypothetical protein